MLYEVITHFNEFGYVSNIKLLEEWQVDQLNEELNIIMDTKHPNHDLLYEFHTNESTDVITSYSIHYTKLYDEN